MKGRTLDELEGVEWGPPDTDSYLVSTCHRLRTKPVDEFTVEDLRIMIGQRIGLRFLIPLALDILEEDPLIEGDYYPGDLLVNVFGAKDSIVGNHELLKRLQRIVEHAEGAVKDRDEPLEFSPSSMLLEFQRGH